MKKSLFNYIAGGLALALAVTLKLYCALADITGTFFDIFCLVLAAGGVCLLIAGFLRQKAQQKDLRAALDRLSTQQFTAQGAETIKTYNASQMFTREFDVSAQAPQPEQTNAVAGVAADRLAYVDPQLTFPEAQREFLAYAADQGCVLSQDTVSRLFAALASSRLLILQDMDSEAFHRFMALVSSYFGGSLYLDRVSESYAQPEDVLFCRETGTSVGTQVFAAVNAAPRAPHQMVFAGLDNVDPQRLSSYFTPFAAYARSPFGRIQLTAIDPHGVSTRYTIPSNLFLVLNATADGPIPTPVAQNAVVERFTLEQGPVRDEILPVRRFSLYQLEYLTEQAVKVATVAEEQWKKLDRLEAALGIDALLDNKQWLSLEKYIHVYLCCGAGVSQALDRAVCVKLLPALLHLQDQAEPKDLAQILEQVFGEEGSMICQKQLRDR